MTDRKASVHDAFRLNLEQQKNRAKDLLEAAKAQDTAALARMAQVRPNGRDALAPHDLKLADAQLVIARELGFPSWPKLKAHIAVMDRERQAIRTKQPALDADLRTAHLRCGSDIRSALVEAGFVGDFIEHSNPYCAGPVTNAPDMVERRATYIAESAGPHMGVSFDDILRGLTEQERQLATSADDYERVVLWAEHDTWDQLMLIQCFAHYANTRAPRVFELVSVNHFPGRMRFIGLGQLPAEAIRMLWSQRRPVSPDQLRLGAQAWAAFTTDDPRALAAIVRAGTPALPDLAPALRRELQELPSLATGLNLTERLLLEAIAENDGATLNHAFRRFQEKDPLPGFPDLMVLDVILRMEQADEKLFTRVAMDGARRFHDQLTITDTGRAVLRGERDWLSLRPPTRWVGGVEIRPGGRVWRWDEAADDAFSP